MLRLLNSVAAKYSVPALAAFAAVATLAASAQGQSLSVPTISAGQALKVVNAAIATCSEPGAMITISVAVVDQAGNPRLMLNADTASPHNLDLARRKAYTARTFRRPSAEWAKDSMNPQAAGQRQLVDVIPLGGGVPITANGQVIGGIGISGARGGQVAENECATKAAAVVANDR